jgi:hypothetical protein
MPRSAASSASLQLSTLFAVAGLLAACPGASFAAPTTIASIAPGSEDASISGMTIENFEDVNLLPGFSVTFSVWRNSSNVILADGPVTYAGSLPATWVCAPSGFPNNPWDGTRALVNGAGHNWAYPFAARIEFTFAPPLTKVGFGLSNIQRDAGSSFTYHSILVNGESHGKLEDLTGWVSAVLQKNRYLVITGDAISSVVIVADTHFDGMVVDKLALDMATPASGSSWGRIKSLYR